VIERKIDYYIQFVIIPGILIVIISYLGFWLSYRSVPGRVTLAVIPILTSVTLLNKGYTKLPNIAYETWLLTFLYCNLIFTILTMLELAVVNVLMMKHD
jgi:hypothetical protein